MYTNWQNLIPNHDNEKTGIIIDALQRFMQFDTFATVIPAGGIDKIFTAERITMLAEQASIFYHHYHKDFDQLSQNMREEMLRAHLAGFIKLPIPDSDHWRHSFSQLHKQNRLIYDKLSTIGRVELLLQRHPSVDIIATSMDHFFRTTNPSYTPNELVNTVLLALEYYAQFSEELTQKPMSEQRATLTQRLQGK